VRFAQKAKKFYNYMEICAINAIGEKNRVQEQKLWEFYPGEEVAKTFLGLRWPRLPHNLG
jgi:hypothetical protein